MTPPSADRVGAGLAIPAGMSCLVLRYSDMQSASRAMQADSSDVSQALIALIDSDSMSVGHYEIVSD
jgi:hypothetical protein